MGPLLCALALPLGYWTGGIDYNQAAPCLHAPTLEHSALVLP